MQNKDNAEIEIPQSSVNKFVNDLAKEATKELNESENDMSEAEMRQHIMEMLGKLKTKEDLKKFIENNKEQMESFQKTGPKSKAKTIIEKLWKFLCFMVKTGLFVLQHLQGLAIIAATIFVCVKFHISPMQALQKGWSAAKTIYKAADVTLSGAKKAADTYSAIQDKSAGIGDKIGGWIGEVFEKGSHAKADREIEALLKKQAEIRAARKPTNESREIAIIASSFSRLLNE